MPSAKAEFTENVKMSGVPLTIAVGVLTWSHVGQLTSLVAVNVSELVSSVEMLLVADAETWDEPPPFK
jgi:hypothetical protein